MKAFGEEFSIANPDLQSVLKENVNSQTPVSNTEKSSQDVTGAFKSTKVYKQGSIETYRIIGQQVN
ncbi:hypothetical protein GcM1_242067 [Golovinomyces cichoracearum]|uniref:Uncharacterized protein n=1 Tax=Golovinomyces cichoracearum TaxID=62708 RepID=A0A420IGY5_9PEZI|nr:hypothetical protein GcM1_242067 [Golovinomyces cichoracearum]